MKKTNHTTEGLRRWLKTTPKLVALSTLGLLLPVGAHAAASITYNTVINTNWTAPAGVTSVTVECWGGGGAGGCASNSIPGSPSTGYCGGGGGGGGAYAKKVVPVTPGNSYAIVINAAATSLATYTNGQRYDGASTTFTGDNGVTVTAAGGQGGASVTNAASTARGAGGSAAASVGDVAYDGGNGATAGTASGGGGGGAGNANPGGNASTSSPGGGGANYGGAGGAGILGNNVGGTGLNAGGGGGGGRSQSGLKLGGKGGLGQIILTFTSSAVVNYYSTGSGDPTSVNSWTNSSGTHPADFTSGIFIIQNGHNMTLSQDWYLAGTDGASGVDVLSGGTLTCGAYNVTGGVSFTLEDGATLSLGSPSGISSSPGVGNIQVTGSRGYGIAANYSYTGGGTQVTGNQLPSIVNNFTATAPVKLSQALTVNGTATLGVAGDATSCTLDLNGTTFTVNALATAGTAANQIIGNGSTAANATLKVKGVATNPFGGVIRDALPTGGNKKTSVTIVNGMLALSGPNTYGNGTTISGGELDINYGGSSSANSAIGTGTLSLVNSMIDNTSAGPVTLLPNNPVTMGNLSGATLTYGGTQDLNLGANQVTLTYATVNTNFVILNGTNRTLTLGAMVGSANQLTTTMQIDGPGNTLVLGSLALNAFTNPVNNIWQGSANVTVNGSVDSGAGSKAQAFTYAGTGTFTIVGPITYAGGTKVSSGKLVIQQPTLATNSVITVGANAVLQLDFAATNTVRNLVVNGVSLIPGVYGQGVGPTNLTGVGSLLVTGSTNDASLTSLILTPAGTLNPTFSSYTTMYTATNSSTDNLTVKVITAYPAATSQLIYNGTTNALTSGTPSSPLSPPLAAGTNVVQVLVTAADLVTTNLYTVNVIVPSPALSTNANLAALALAPAGMLNPVFDSNTTNYTASVAYANNPVTVTATSADPNATLQLSVNGAAFTAAVTNNLTVAGNTLNLTPSPVNTVVVQVTAPDGVTTNLYTVSAVLQPSLAGSKLSSSVSGGSLVLNWPVDHTGYRLLQQTNNLSKGVSTNMGDWGPVEGAAATNTLTVPITTTILNEYYRLVYP